MVVTDAIHYPPCAVSPPEALAAGSALTLCAKSRCLRHAPGAAIKEVAAIVGLAGPHAGSGCVVVARGVIRGIPVDDAARIGDPMWYDTARSVLLPRSTPPAEGAVKCGHVIDIDWPDPIVPADCDDPPAVLAPQTRHWTILFPPDSTARCCAIDIDPHDRGWGGYAPNEGDRRTVVNQSQVTVEVYRHAADTVPLAAIKPDKRMTWQRADGEFSALESHLRLATVMYTR